MDLDFELNRIRSSDVLPKTPIKLADTQVRYGKGPVPKIEQNIWTLQNDSRLLDWHKIWHGKSHCQFKSKTVTIFKKVTWLSIPGVKTIQI